MAETPASHLELPPLSLVHPNQVLVPLFKSLTYLSHPFPGDQWVSLPISQPASVATRCVLVTDRAMAVPGEQGSHFPLCRVPNPCPTKKCPTASCRDTSIFRVCPLGPMVFPYLGPPLPWGLWVTVPQPSQSPYFPQSICDGQTKCHHVW